MKKHLTLLLLPTMALLLQGCKDKTEYCPCYPQGKTDYMPIDFVGQTMRYILDEDTFALKVLPTEFSEEYAKDSDKALLIWGCYAQALLNLASDDTTQVLAYGLHYYPDSEKYYLSVNFHDRVHSEHLGAVLEDIYRDVQNAELMPQWTSPTGHTYTDVVKSTEMITAIGIDTLYLSKRYGLLHWYIHGGHTLTLLP